MKDGAIANLFKAFLCGLNEGRSYRQFVQSPSVAIANFFRALLFGLNDGAIGNFSEPFARVA